MWSIEASQIKGKAVLLAPLGTEVDRTPCLVYHDPQSLVPYSRVVDKKHEVITAKTERGLRGAAKRMGLTVTTPRIYLP